MILLIDNYDSFTYNLRSNLGELGAEVEVVRNDAIDLAGVAAKQPEPHRRVAALHPNEAGISVPLIGRLPAGADSRRLPRPPEHRRCVRWQHHSRPARDARQNLNHHAQPAGLFRRDPEPLHRGALSLS